MLPKALAAKWLKDETLNTSKLPVSAPKKSLKESKSEQPVSAPKKPLKENKLKQSVSAPKKLLKEKASKRVSKKSRRFTIDTLPESSSIPEFDEEIQQIGVKYKLDSGSMKNALDGLVSFISSRKSKTDLFGDEPFSLYIQINGFKVPQSHSKIARITLKHSYYSPDSDICLIVPDVKGIQNKNHEEHVEFYEKMLAQKGVTNIKKIMTFHELRTEYETYELKHRLVELYDLFLVDGKISGKTVKKCGKIFYKKSKIATAIRLDARVRQNIDLALKKTSLYLHSKADSFRVKIGHSKMPTCDLVENIFYLVKGLDGVFPGGFNNVRSLLLSGSKGIKIPIYMTLSKYNFQ